jgi:23S rRNA pseudouridine2605 synthase
VRLQRFLASCGLGSRRACEDLIDQGVVAVDGEIVSRQGVVVDPSRQTITVQGRPVRPQRIRYLLYNKPMGVVCTSNDPEGRATFLDVLPPEYDDTRWFSVGRLDMESEGLLLLTNDGDMTYRLTHPRHHIPKTYHVWVDRRIGRRDKEQILAGLWDQGEKLRALSLKPIPRGADVHVVEIVLGEGRNRHIRRMLAALDIHVLRLRRVALGPLALKNQRLGSFRLLRPDEIEALQKAAGLVTGDKA